MMLPCTSPVSTSSMMREGADTLVRLFPLFYERAVDMPGNQNLHLHLPGHHLCSHQIGSMASHLYLADPDPLHFQHGFIQQKSLETHCSLNCRKPSLFSPDEIGGKELAETKSQA